MAHRLAQLLGCALEHNLNAWPQRDAGCETRRAGTSSGSACELGKARA